MSKHIIADDLLCDLIAYLSELTTSESEYFMEQLQVLRGTYVYSKEA